MIKVHVYIKGMRSVYFQGNATHYFILQDLNWALFCFKNKTLHYYQVGPWQLTLVSSYNGEKDHLYSLAMVLISDSL